VRRHSPFLLSGREASRPPPLEGTWRNQSRLPPGKGKNKAVPAWSKLAASECRSEPAARHARPDLARNRPRGIRLAPPGLHQDRRGRAERPVTRVGQSAYSQCAGRCTPVAAAESFHAGGDLKMPTTSPTFTGSTTPAAEQGERPTSETNVGDLERWASVLG